MTATIENRDCVECNNLMSQVVCSLYAYKESIFTLADVACIVSASDLQLRQDDIDLSRSVLMTAWSKHKAHFATHVKTQP